MEVADWRFNLMHARNNAAFIQSPLVADPVRKTIDSLRLNNGSEAVRQLLLAATSGAFSLDGVAGAFRLAGAEDLLSALHSALAAYGCPHCRSGFDVCLTCAGSGHGEEDAHVCTECRGVGVTWCDFCGGSGLLTYDLMPDDVRANVAAIRTQDAEHRVAEAARQPLPATASKEQLASVRKSLVKRALDVRRDLAILTNAAQFARDFRSMHPDRRAFTAQLFRHSSQPARWAKVLAGKLFAMIARVTRAYATLPGIRHPASFELERADVFEALARELSTTARRRSTLFPGH